MSDDMRFEPRSVHRDTVALTRHIPVPGFGVLPVNAFLIRAAEPVLVDTGLAATRDTFIRDLEESIDPEELRWIWITHADADHVGNLAAVLERAPQAKVITTFLGMGKLAMQGFALDRVHLLNPGQSLSVGDRTLTAVAPPTYDAPETTGLFDDRTGALFTADGFGALMNEPEADAAAMAPDALREGLIAWAGVDAPWLHMVSPDRLEKTLREVTRHRPEVLLSSHLPPARGLTETLIGALLEAREAPPFVGPDQAALEQMMAAA